MNNRDTNPTTQTIPPRQTPPRAHRAGGTRAASAASAGRDTATFEPYYWEAYNEIVRPGNYDWYLVTRWMPDLGPLGFAIVKALRNLCYFNPREGVLRDTCEIDVAEIAAQVGASRPTVYRELERNEALQAFVQKQEQIGWKGDRPVRHKPVFRVCMDTPVHPADLERYEELRAAKECDRRASEGDIPGRYRVKPKPGAADTGGPKSQNEIRDEERKSHFEISELPKSQIETRKSQNETPKSQNEISLIGVSLPSGGSIPSVSIPPRAAGDAPPIDSPRGEGEQSHGGAVTAEDVGEALRDSLLCAAWTKALNALATVVNRPTFEAHLKPLRPLSLDYETGAVELLCPSAFTREWLDKRHRLAIEKALGVALVRDVSVRLTAPTTSDE